MAYAARPCAGLLALPAIFALATAADVSVVTPVGEVIGFQQNVSVDNHVITISKFLGIPYAEPPLGDLRFRKPVAKATFEEPFSAREFGTRCIQVQYVPVDGPTSEDCLFLNIFVPERNASDANLAVMIFIHGGGFIVGSSNEYQGDILAARGGVIVVTMNYRLSALGFLNLRDGSPGNFGLWDQHLAIRWVHDNIRAFGGDETSVTIFGESAGAASVVYQAIYPGNRGLVQRVIAESGTASVQWGESRQPRAEALEFAGLVGCNNRTLRATLDCLRAVPGSLINYTLNDFSNGLLRNPVPFVPSPDDDFLSVSSRIVLHPDNHDSRVTDQRDVFAGMDLMIGTNSGEGAIFLSPEFGVYGDPEYFSPNRSYFEDPIVPLCAKSEYGEDVARAVFESLINVYTPWDDPDDPTELRLRYVDMHSDIQFLAPTMATVELYSRVSSRAPYVYYFTATPATHLGATPSWLGRPDHGDELLYVFGGFEMLAGMGVPGDIQLQQWEHELSRTVMAYWTNFAKTGNPNTPRDPGVAWGPYSPLERRYLDLGRFLNQTAMRERLHEQRTHLWNTVLPLIHQQTSARPCVTSGARKAVTSAPVVVGLCVAGLVYLRLIYAH